MAGNEAIKILSGLWAEDGDRIDPDDASLDVVVTRTVGWPDSFSEAAGNQPPRRIWNQRFRELDGAASDAMRYGILPYDPAVDYPVRGLTAVGRGLYRAVEANGPTSSNVTHPTTGGQTAWASVPGRVTAPTAPAAPTATADNGALDWTWNCPRDGGRLIDSFDMQWRRGSGAWSVSVSVSIAYWRLTGLTNGETYQIRVRARSSIGVSGWSALGSGSPAASDPGKVVGLVAFDGDDRAVRLRWELTDTGGATISRYEVQWRTATQAYTTGRQATTTNTFTSIASLTNGTAYLFRVRAVSVAGNGAWSDEASATPADPPAPPPEIPADRAPAQVPSAPTATSVGSGLLWTWPHPADGGRRITRFEVQVRSLNAGWPSTDVDTVSSCFRQQAAAGGTTYEARARAVNALGTGAWSATGRATA